MRLQEHQLPNALHLSVHNLQAAPLQQDQHLGQQVLLGLLPSQG
jgi:hypothetical protein